MVAEFSRMVGWEPFLANAPTYVRTYVRTVACIIEPRGFLVDAQPPHATVSEEDVPESAQTKRSHIKTANSRCTFDHETFSFIPVPLAEGPLVKNTMRQRSRRPG